MKNISALLLFGILTFGLFGLNSCQKDDDDMGGDNEQEVITTVQLEFTPAGGGSPVTFVFSDNDGPGGQDPVKDQIALTAGATYELKVEFIDRSNPADPEFITEEVQDEAEEHLVCYAITGGVLTATAKDQDVNGKPLGLIADVQAGAAGAGTLTISLKHMPSKDAATPCNTGDTDVEAEFAVVVN